MYINLYYGDYSFYACAECEALERFCRFINATRE